MASIIKNVEKRKKQLTSPDAAAASAAGAENQRLAVAAIVGGIRSPAWEEYMVQYAKDDAGEIDPDLLMRLLGTDGTLGNTGLDTKRAYLVGNAVCAQGTGPTLDREVNSIDAGITNGCV